MQIYSNKTLNGKLVKHANQIIANWYEDRLVREQLFKTKPELRVVSVATRKYNT